jgi:hypothetical protein
LGNVGTSAIDGSGGRNGDDFVAHGVGLFFGVVEGLLGLKQAYFVCLGFILRDTQDFKPLFGPE